MDIESEDWNYIGKGLPSGAARQVRHNLQPFTVRPEVWDHLCLLSGWSGHWDCQVHWSLEPLLCVEHRFPRQAGSELKGAVEPRNGLFRFYLLKPRVAFSYHICVLPFVTLTLEMSVGQFFYGAPLTFSLSDGVCCLLSRRRPCGFGSFHPVGSLMLLCLTSFLPLLMWPLPGSLLWSYCFLWWWVYILGKIIWVSADTLFLFRFGPLFLASTVCSRHCGFS